MLILEVIFNVIKCIYDLYLSLVANDDFLGLGVSLMNIIYKSGPRTDPCGTPDSGENGSEQIPLILVSMVLLTSKLASVLQSSSGILKLLNIL